MMFRYLSLIAITALGATGCIQSSGGRVQGLSVQTVSVAPDVSVPRRLTRTDSGQTLAKAGVRIDDVARREFFVALDKSHHFPRVVGAVPQTPVDSDWDIDAQSTRRFERGSISSAQAFFELKVHNWGFRGASLFGSTEHAWIDLEAQLVDRAGNVLAWGRANNSDSTVPERFPNEYLGDAKLTSNDVSIAARIASERLIEAMMKASPTGHNPPLRNRKTTQTVVVQKTKTTTARH